jgi:predicted transcriptional regulator
MDAKTISFRIDADKIDALDTLARSLDRDRSYLLNQAVDAYLDVQAWQLQQVRASLRQVAAGKTVDHSQVRKLASRWRNK